MESEDKFYHRQVAKITAACFAIIIGSSLTLLFYIVPNSHTPPLSQNFYYLWRGAFSMIWLVVVAAGCWFMPRPLNREKIDLIPGPTPTILYGDKALHPDQIRRFVDDNRVQRVIYQVGYVWPIYFIIEPREYIPIQGPITEGGACLVLINGGDKGRLFRPTDKVIRSATEDQREELTPGYWWRRLYNQQLSPGNGHIVYVPSDNERDDQPLGSEFDYQAELEGLERVHDLLGDDGFEQAMQKLEAKRQAAERSHQGIGADGQGSELISQLKNFATAMADLSRTVQELATDTKQQLDEFGRKIDAIEKTAAARSQPRHDKEPPRRERTARPAGEIQPVPLNSGVSPSAGGDTEAATP